LISFLILSLNSFSQTDTSKVVLSSKIARQVAKELILFDGCKSELEQTQDKISKILQRESQKDSIISILYQKDSNNQFIADKKSEQLKVALDLSKSLEKELRGYKTKNLLLKIGFFGSTATAAYLLILK